MVTPTSIKDLYIIENFKHKDNRGLFIKTFNNSIQKELNLEFVIKESFYSKSYKDVIRGMHFQIPPLEHHKLVYVTEGEIIDVVIDLRKGSATFGQHFSIKLAAFSQSLFIPKGCAHGFLTLTESATVIYNVTSEYHQEYDFGIHWNSFGFNWGIKNPIISDRDNSFVSFKNYISHFK